MTRTASSPCPSLQPQIQSGVHPYPPMQPGALRALEFDRIVEAVRSFALTPMGDERLGRLAPSIEPPEVAELAGRRRARPFAISDRNALFPLRALERAAACADGARGRRAAARTAAAAGARRLSRFDRGLARRHPSRGGIVSVARGHHQRRRLVQARNDARSREDRTVGRRRRPREPRAEADSRAAPEAADAAARHARIVPARQGDGEVPAGSGRHRTQRPLRARHQGGASQLDSRHRARRLDERREPVSRAAQHRRDQQRHRRARGAGARRNPPHSPRADRRVPRPRDRASSGRSRPRPSWTCCRRGRAFRCWSAASSRSSRPTARSSCRRRGIRC